MGLLDLINHILNFIAPACVVGCLLACVAPWIQTELASRRGRWWQCGLNSVAGIGALLVGLWFYGHDGKMVTYGAMVLVIATTQWLSARAWR